MRTIEIYGQKNCRHCEQAVQRCAAGNHLFIYRDIFDRMTRDEMLRRNPLAKSVPQIFIGNTHIGGCEDLLSLPDFQLQQMIGE